MSDIYRFDIVYSKMRQVLDADARLDRLRALAETRHATDASREELDEIARLRQIVLETTSPDPVSYTTT